MEFQSPREFPEMRFKHPYIFRFVRSFTTRYLGTWK
jgi:hypothetical protein